MCHEGSQEELLAEQAIHRVDLVLSDAPVPATVEVRGSQPLAGQCEVVFMASPRLASKYRRGFPGSSLDSAPVLVPVEGAVLRRSLEQGFDAQKVHPVVVGEFDDSALLKVFVRRAPVCSRFPP